MKKLSLIPDLSKVSEICKKTLYCKSRFINDNTFSVETWSGEDGKDPRVVWIDDDVDPENKFYHLEKILNESGFFDELHEKCGKKATCNVLIKPNISIAAQKNLLNYTDPELVEWLADRIERDGSKKVTIVESKNAFTLVRDDHEPIKISKNIGYKRDVIDLSVEGEIPVPFKEGNITISPRARDADFIINFPKARNHMQRKMTNALKNMYGIIPSMNKFELYHWKGSGIGMEEAAIAANHSTPADFTIVDMIHTIDGNDDHVLFYRKDYHVSPRILMVGKDPLAIDKAMAIKMGYDQNAPPVTKAEINFRGDFDIRAPGLVNGSLDIIKINGKSWKKPTLNPLFSFLLDDALKMIEKLPFVREGMKMVGQRLWLDVLRDEKHI